MDASLSSEIGLQYPTFRCEENRDCVGTTKVQIGQARA